MKNDTKAVHFGKKNKTKQSQKYSCDFLIICAFVILSQILHSFLGEISNGFYDGKSTKRNI